MSVFNLTDQNDNLDNKIVAGLERLSQVFRILLWEKAKAHGLSPIQIQLLIFIQYHTPEKTTISYLAHEFNVTKPTVSDAVKILAQKDLVNKITDPYDTRSYTIQLTDRGRSIVADTENFANPLTDIITKTERADKVFLWENITHLIRELNRQKIISIQRTCFNCRHYSLTGNIHYCNLLGQTLQNENIRIDCPEFAPAY